MVRKGRILTGHRPTGRRHLGHLVGTLETWAKLQDEYECFFLIADLHVLTTDYTHPERIRGNVVEVLMDWLAAGLDPDKSTFVLQSAVREHVELALLFSMLVTVSRLERNPTYKEQVRELKLSPSLGLLTYPVLQAADILVYKADTVPVGEDQLPHLEISREIARRFNNLYGQTFPEPQALLSSVPRLVGTDGRTMHTSYGNTIPLSAEPAEIEQAVTSMVTDPARIHPTDPGHPEVCIVFSYHSTFNRGAVAEIEESCRRGRIGCVQCKRRLAQVLQERLEPFRRIRRELAKRPDYLWDILREGVRRATPIARATVEEAKAKMGLVSLR